MDAVTEEEPENEPIGSAEPDDAPSHQRFDCREPQQRAAGIDAARRAVEAGECVVLPTDTVYGIGANSFSASAVQRLLDAKGRGRDMPPPVLIAEPSVMMALGRDIPEPAKRLAEQHWPGPLTIILQAQPSLQMDLGETRGTIAVRVPDHELARELLRATGPLAVSSANRTGRPAATDAEVAVDQLGDRVAVYLDDGPTRGAEPSTIVDFTRSDYGAVVRHGALSIDELRRTVPYLDDRVPAPASAEPDPDPTPEPVSENESNGAG
ncbi:threonylcarbamoyl-AMP synthase [Enemella evansiae]|nr:threonylcarbamoyl-AMP synthase [Enemella evansiae]